MGKVLIVGTFILLLSLAKAQQAQIKIAQKMFQYIPEIRDQYSITHTQLYPQQNHQIESNPHPNNNPNTLSILNPLPNNNGLNANKHPDSLIQRPMPQPIKQPQIDNNKDQKAKSTKSTQTIGQKVVTQKGLQFEQFHKIQFQANKKYIVKNIDERSVLNTEGKVIELEGKETPLSAVQNQEKPNIFDKIIENLKITPRQQPPINIPTHINEQKKLPSPPTELPIQTTTISTQTSKQRMREISKILKRNESAEKQQPLTKIIYSILLGISIVVVVFGYKPGDDKRKPYIPTNDDEQNTLQ